MREKLTGYYAPKNFNLWYYFGSLAIVALVNQLVTGIWLTMHYKPSATEHDTLHQLVTDLLDRAFGGSTARLVVQALASKRATSGHVIP